MYLNNIRQHYINLINDYTIKNNLIWINNSDYANNYTKLILKDKDGYLYYINYRTIEYENNLMKFSKSNPYTIQNIKLWLIINNIELELVSDTYENSHKPLIFKDKYGYYYFQCMNNFQNGEVAERFHIANPFTIQNIKMWIKLNNKPFEIISELYEGSQKKLSWKCKKDGCGETYPMKWGHVYDNIGCPYCVGMQVGLSNCLATKRPDLATQWHPTKNGTLTPYDVTCGSEKYVWWQCNQNPKHEWKAQVCKRTSDRNCPYCVKGGFVLPSEDYNLLVYNPTLCEEWDYGKNNKRPEEYTPNSEQKVWWKCKDCGYEWKGKISKRNKNNRGCPECNDSKGEKRIKDILKLNNIPYDKQYTFYDLLSDLGNPLRFDVPIFWDKEKTQLRMLIEYDGEQHFKRVEGWYTKKQFETLQYHDKLKNEYCINNNISLLRIKYDEFDKIEDILCNTLNLEKSVA